MKLNPSAVIMLECSEDISVNRLKERKVDPITGIYYNVNNMPEDDEIKARLEQHSEDKEDVVKKRWRVWDDFIGKIEETYGALIHTIKTESQSPNDISDSIATIIQNPCRS